MGLDSLIDLLARCALMAILAGFGSYAAAGLFWEGKDAAGFVVAGITIAMVYTAWRQFVRPWFVYRHLLPDD